MYTEKSGIPHVERCVNPQPENHGVMVLLAEDEPMLRQIVGRVLHEAGYDLMMAEDGCRALQLAKEHTGRIDILLSDIQMPGLTGVDLAVELLRSRPDLKIVLMSGCISTVSVLKREWRFLQKPFGANKLLDEVRTALD